MCCPATTPDPMCVLLVGSFLSPKCIILQNLPWEIKAHSLDHIFFWLITKPSLMHPKKSITVCPNYAAASILEGIRQSLKHISRSQALGAIANPPPPIKFLFRWAPANHNAQPLIFLWIESWLFPLDWTSAWIVLRAALLIREVKGAITYISCFS